MFLSKSQNRAGWLYAYNLDTVPDTVKRLNRDSLELGLGIHISVRIKLEREILLRRLIVNRSLA